MAVVLQPGKHLLKVEELLAGQMMGHALSILMMEAVQLMEPEIVHLLGHLEPRHQLMVINKMVSMLDRKLLDILAVEMLGDLVLRLQLTNHKLPMTVGQIHQLETIGVQMLMMLRLPEPICPLRLQLL